MTSIQYIYWSYIGWYTRWRWLNTYSMKVTQHILDNILEEGHSLDALWDESHSTYIGMMSSDFHVMYYEKAVFTLYMKARIRSIPHVHKKKNVEWLSRNILWQTGIHAIHESMHSLDTSCPKKGKKDSTLRFSNLTNFGFVNIELQEGFRQLALDSIQRLKGILYQHLIVSSKQCRVARARHLART